MPSFLPRTLGAYCSSPARSFRIPTAITIGYPALDSILGQVACPRAAPAFSRACTIQPGPPQRQVSTCFTWRSINAHLDATGARNVPDAPESRARLRWVFCVWTCYRQSRRHRCRRGGPTPPTTTPLPDAHPDAGTGLAEWIVCHLTSTDRAILQPGIGPQNACIEASPGRQLTIDVTAHGIPFAVYE